MRNRTEFGKTESSTKPKTIKNKYFLIYEGSRTEKIYFEGIIAHKESIGITSLIQLIPLYRNFSEEGRSNPKIILQDTIDYLEKDMNDDTYTPSRLGEMIFSYLEDYGYIKILSFEIKNSIYQSLKQYINEKITKKNGLIVDKLEAITKILNFLENKKSIQFTISSLYDYLNKQESIVYDKGIDKVCFIFDRDEQSFKANQYDLVKEECTKRNFKLFISNPTFEFWLLLHFKEVMEIDRDTLLQNPKERPQSKKRYLEKVLTHKNLIPGYTKHSYNFTLLSNRITLAIKQEKEFCEDIEKLKSELGSNIGTLISELIESSNK